jgi:hypothetical protein
MGHRVDMTTRDSGSGVVTTWVPISANATSSHSPIPVRPSQALPHGHGFASVIHPRPPPPLAIPPDPNQAPNPHNFFGYPPPRPPPPLTIPSYLNRPPNPPAFFGYHPPRPPPLDHHQFPNPAGKLPKVPFPRFDGENPRRWLLMLRNISKCILLSPHCGLVFLRCILMV